MDRVISWEKEKPAAYFHCLWQQKKKKCVKRLVQCKLRYYIIAEGYVSYMANLYGLEGINKIFSSLEKMAIS